MNTKPRHDEHDGDNVTTEATKRRLFMTAADVAYVLITSVAQHTGRVPKMCPGGSTCTPGIRGSPCG
jgi:hypothetical protein